MFSVLTGGYQRVENSLIGGMGAEAEVWQCLERWVSHRGGAEMN
jgi:hypothetical protein